MTNNRSIHVRCASGGYSLAELTVGILCAAILISIAVPNLVRIQRGWELWGGARVLEASLQWGRMRAVSTNAPMLFEVDGDRRKFYWVDPASSDVYSSSVRELSRGLRISACPRRPLRFYPHGTAAPSGTYTIEGVAGSYSVVVSPGGRIRIQKT